MSDGGALSGTGKRKAKRKKRHGIGEFESTNDAESAAQARENAIAAYKAMKHSATATGNAGSRGTQASTYLSSSDQKTKQNFRQYAKDYVGNNRQSRTGSISQKSDSGVGGGNVGGKKRMSKAERKRMAKRKRTAAAANGKLSSS